ncbi:MAG: hypothetical protein P8166_18710 [Candidatus Thiodiazotropha sp.]
MAKLFDNRLRPAVELLPAMALTGLGGILFLQPDTIAPMMPGVATSIAGLFLTAAAWRTVQAARVLDYRSRLWRLPRLNRSPGRHPGCFWAEASAGTSATANAWWRSAILIPASI